ncbi:unnamed protein product [Aspergillus oryzae RIB40]|uniref:DNA, SC012 n=1 Tax=Aspergillus oryzae (strain ATCC 42149 / RIB 40) TaxID=510516 RepID=Q2UCV0_ASPOR|nr:unnamed protein product [Aspergillus oryzae RIB40]BAE60615.1 unnamed protein product [Aspergillus oryzae RIB40]
MARSSRPHSFISTLDTRLYTPNDTFLQRPHILTQSTTPTTTPTTKTQKSRKMGVPESESPAVQQQNEWSNGFWDCCSPAGTSNVYRTQASGAVVSPAVSSCCLYYLTAQVGFHWVLLMIRRGEIRQRFGIEGSGVSDCCSSYWCPCCVIVQQEKEIEAQSERLQTGYQAPAGMAYAPQ